MKVLLVTEFFPDPKKLNFTGGVETRTFFIARNLAKKEKVAVICRRTKKINKVMKVWGISVYPCGFKTINIEANFFSVIERIIFILSAFFQGLKLDFDLVEGSNFVSFLPAYFLGLIKKKPTVAWYADVFQGRWFQFFGFTGFFGEIMEWISLKLHWSKIIALSKATKLKLVKQGIKPEKIEVVYGGVNKIQTVKGKKQSFEKKNIICISRLVKYKRVTDLINAFSQLGLKYPFLNLIIIGQGPEEKNLKKIVKKENLSKKVIFMKNLNRKELITLLKKALIFCSASLVEGFGLTTIEALSCQTPFVIPDMAVNREITENSQGGLLFKNKDVKDLRKKIEMLLIDKALYKQKQKEALVLAGKYDWKKISNQTQAVYNKALGNRAINV